MLPGNRGDFLMSSPMPVRRVLEQAEACVLRWERGSRSATSLTDFANQVIRELADLCNASGSVGCFDSVNHTIIASYAHESLEPTPIVMDTFDAITNLLQPIQPIDFSPKANWQRADDRDPSSLAVLQVSQSLHPHVVLLMTLCMKSDFRQRHHSQDAQTLEDLSKAALEIIAVVYLRDQFSHAMERTGSLDGDAKAMLALHQGTTLRESLQAIAAAWARRVNADRVSILRRQGQRAVLVASSTKSVIDRKSHHVVRLESLIDELRKSDEELHFALGKTLSHPSPSYSSLDAYLSHSGCREIESHTVRDRSHPQSWVAVIVTEWFTGDAHSRDDVYRQHVVDATALAIARDRSVWSRWISKIDEDSFRRRCVIAMATVLAFAMALLMWPIRLTIPAEGRMVPATQQRLFAPADALVTQVFVVNGQEVLRGERLVALRSASIELREEQLRGELQTAKTQLSSLLANRSKERRSESGQAVDSTASESEEVLKVQIAGWEKQIALIESQKASLMITSPMAGKVDRWDISQSLPQRPLAQGQYLMDVYSPQDGWIAELDIADKDLVYLESVNQKSLVVRCRLRSQPREVFSARVIDVARSAQTDSTGRSRIRLRCGLEDPAAVPHSVGATVWADIECGKRSMGFVWFRGLIEWWERQTWY
jgi:glycine cleavage system H lipoate-binding protein